MVEAEAISPWDNYAKNKSRELGGAHDDYVAEYHSRDNRLLEILEEKDLMKDVPTRLRSDVESVRHPKTLFEAGLIEELPLSAKHYGLDTPGGFFQALTYSAVSSYQRQEVATIMGMDENALGQLYEKVTSVLGEEYRAISNELNKYVK